MSDIHVLAGDDRGRFKVVMHFAVPVGPIRGALVGRAAVAAIPGGPTVPQSVLSNIDVPERNLIE